MTAHRLREGKHSCLVANACLRDFRPYVEQRVVRCSGVPTASLTTVGIRYPRHRRRTPYGKRVGANGQVKDKYASYSREFVRVIFENHERARTRARRTSRLGDRLHGCSCAHTTSRSSRLR